MNSKWRLPRKEKKKAKFGLKFIFNIHHYNAYKIAKKLSSGLKWK